MCRRLAAGSARRIDAVVSERPEGYRAVLQPLLNRGVFPSGGLPECLGINEKSSSSQLFRARAMLARRVREYLDTH